VAAIGRVHRDDIHNDSNTMSLGLGDTVAKITTTLGIKPCPGCKKRQEAMNRMFPYANVPGQREFCPICDWHDPMGNDPEHTGPGRQSWAESPITRDQHISVLQSLLRAKFITPELSGDGIVYSGEGELWPMTVVACKMAREVGCTLPIQVWSHGHVGRELDGYDITLIDMDEHRNTHPARILDKYETKSYCMLHSGFRRVLFLDSDAYLVNNPEPLFDLLDHDPFVYWQDTADQLGSVRWIWTGHDNSRGVVPVQGGHILVDQQAWWQGMMIQHWMSMHSDYWWRHHFGDQDSYRVILAGSDLPYRCLGRASWTRVAFVCHHDGKPYIVHRCRSKLLGARPVTYDRLPREDRIMELYRGLVPSHLSAPRSIEQIPRHEPTARKEIRARKQMHARR
jgi:hypothetical protein